MDGPLFEKKMINNVASWMSIVHCWSVLMSKKECWGGGVINEEKTLLIFLTGSFRIHLLCPCECFVHLYFMSLDIFLMHIFPFHSHTFIFHVLDMFILLFLNTNPSH